MLTVFRSNRAEWLADLLAAQLLQNPPDPFETVQVVVNTWPTSRWLGERLAVGLGGVAANLRFPFPGSLLRRLVQELLGTPGGDDPWRASALVWPVLELLPQLVAEPEAGALRRWLELRQPGAGAALELASWQLGRAIADALDDTALYRPDLLAHWWEGGQGDPVGEELLWQARLVQLLRQRLGVKPFGLQVLEVVRQLQGGAPPPGQLPAVLRLFGLSSMAPVQVQLLQALSRHCQVDLYLLTPGPDLWQRCGSRRAALSDAIALQQPLEGDWLLQAPGLEARFGRLGGEFQQLLEGSGEVQLGQWQERDLFADPTGGDGAAPLLHQLQRQLAQGDHPDGTWLRRLPGDTSLEFHPCPGRLRQVQIVRDRILQLLAADSSLEPRDVLVMTPQVDAFAPLLASVFGDTEATGVELPWRLTDRSQQSEAGLGHSLLQLLRLAAERFTASGLEALLASPVLQRHFQLDGDAITALHHTLQEVGFRWGLDARERGGVSRGSLAWACDRLLLGLVLPDQPGLVAGGVAPHGTGQSLELVGRWLHLLGRLRHWLARLRQPQPADAWAILLRTLLTDLFGAEERADGDLAAVLAALDGWQRAARGCSLTLPASVVAAGLDEQLSADSGRFGHRSGALTISALEPMRAIPHRVIVLMGLDAGAFPRQQQRPGFHPLERRRQLGDPNPADQDRYVLLEALLSARDHLLVTWSCRDERRGEPLPPATPVRQWLDWLEEQLGAAEAGALVVEHAANPLDRRNFLASAERPPASNDRRLLAARRWLDQRPAPPPPQPLARAAMPTALTPTNATPTSPAAPAKAESGAEAYRDLRDWLVAPQARWLQELGLQPQEWADGIDDLEPLALEERQRSQLLRRALADTGTAGSDGDSETGSEAAADPGHWLQLQRGRAGLPPGAAAALEAAELARRWRDLQASLQGLGPARPPQPLGWGPWQHSPLWRGDQVVLVHTARGRCRHRLELWLQLLLTCAAGAAPRQGVLVARGERGFGIQQRLAPLAQDDARRELERLAALREQWRPRCWPVPPETGWSWLEKGPAQAIATWEGGPMQRGEREQPEHALCFGARLPGAELLQPDFGPLAEAWLAPLLGHLRDGQP